MTVDMENAKGHDIPHMVRCTCAFALIVLGTWTLNEFVFPVYDSHSLNLRDISMVTTGTFFIILAVLANRTTRPFASKRFAYFTILCVALAIITFIGGVVSGSGVLIVITALLHPLGNSLVYVLVCVACMDLEHRDVGVVVVAGIVIAFLLRFPMQALPADIAPSVSMLLRLAVPFVITPDLKRNFLELSESDSIRDAQLAQPRSFLPFGSQIFICMFIFRLIFGVALTYNEVERVPIDTGFEIVPVLLVAIYLFVQRGRSKDCNPDLVFRIAFLFVVAGFLTIPISAGVPEGAANALLYSGSSLFDIVAWYVIIAIGTRNRLGAISVFCWGTAMNAFGVVIGANVGRMLGAGGLNEMSQGLYVAIIILVFVAYISYFLSHQRFASVISSITPVEQVSADEIVPETPRDVNFHEMCVIVAKRYELTPREADVFELLARGRNGHYIQEELTVSYNTVKTHVLHIYTKLGVHTQQELIDLVTQ